MNEHELFAGALEIDAPDERSAYLDRACGGDDALRARIEALLRAHEQAGSFLAAPTVAGLATMDAPKPLEGHGTVIGPYKLVQPIGEGGMGTVYMAEQTAPVRRLVALKLIKAGMDTHQVLARFDAERQALALMDHPNIARVLDAGATETGRPYFVMELVKGVPITRYCDDRRLTLRERLELFVPVCQAVQHAHQKGVIHRDLKPSNVLIALYDGKPVPKVIDFGVAKATGPRLTEQTLYTEFGSVVGTLQYMSPEQAELNQLDIDTRSDIYSLGVLLYELLTGSTPLEHKRLKGAAILEMLRVIREEEAPRPSTRLSTTEELPSIAACRQVEPRKLSGMVQGELDWIVMKALEKDRNRRYESANSLAADLRRYLDDEPVQACPPSAWYRFRKFARRHKTGVVAAVSIFLGILLAVGGLVAALLVLASSNAQIKDEKKRTDDALLRETKANENYARARADAVADAYRALLGETQALRLARSAGWRGTALSNLQRLVSMDTPQRDLAGLRSEAVACLAELDVKELIRLDGHTLLVYGLDFSPDGKYLASADYNGHVIVWDLAEGRQTRRITDRDASVTGMWSESAPMPFVRFQPGGDYLAYTTWGRHVEFLGWKDPKTAPPPLRRKPQPRELAFDRKGGLLAVSWGDGQVGLYDAATGAVRRLIAARTPQSEGFYMPLALSPAGDLVATRGPGHAVQLHTVAAEGEPRVLGHHAALIRSLAFSPDGKRLVSASEDRTAQLWDVPSGKALLTFQGHTSSVMSVAFSPDGELVATGGDDQTIRLWGTRTGQSLLSVRPGGFPEVLTFSPDGRRLAAGCSSSVIVYELAHRLGRQLSGRGHVTMALAMHPCRPLLASASRNLDVSLDDLSTGQKLQSSILPGLAGNLAFSPDGRLLAVAPYSIAPMSQPMSCRDVYIMETETGTVRRRLSGSYSAAVAFDPSGRRLALGGQDGAVTVCDVESGETLHRWRATMGWISGVAFCRGGRQLLVGEVGGSLRVCGAADGRTIRWATLPRGLLRFAMDPEERHVAAADLFGTVRVLALSDMQVVGTIEQSRDTAQQGLGYSSDGRWLAVGGADRRVTVYDACTLRRVFQLPLRNGAVWEVACQPHGPGLAEGGAEEMIAFWDLAEVERALTANGLGWEGVPANGTPGRPQTHPVSRSRFGASSVTVPEWLIWNLQQILETDPDQADSCMELAWILVTAPAKLRDATKALPLARRAVELTSGDPLCLNTLGAVYYRLDRWKEAAETLRAAGRANPEGPTAYDLFFLAMTYRQTGELEKAKRCYDQGVRWCRARAELRPDQVGELGAIRAEADLGATSTSTSELPRESSTSKETVGATENVTRASGGVAAGGDVPQARLVIESPKQGTTVGMREDLTGRIESEGWPVIFVQADIPWQPWWCQAPIAQIEGGRFTTKVVFGDELTPSGMQFRIVGIVARTREEAAKFAIGSKQQALPEGYPRSVEIVVTHR
jgi:WD40 repeat protein/serine/threonine protein kinase